MIGWLMDVEELAEREMAGGAHVLGGNLTQWHFSTYLT
jgi:hypothetical protein